MPTIRSPPGSTPGYGNKQAEPILCPGTRLPMYCPPHPYLPCRPATASCPPDTRLKINRMHRQSLLAMNVSRKPIHNTNNRKTRYNKHNSTATHGKRMCQSFNTPPQSQEGLRARIGCWLPPSLVVHRSLVIRCEALASPVGLAQNIGPQRFPAAGGERRCPSGGPASPRTAPSGPCRPAFEGRGE